MTSPVLLVSLVSSFSLERTALDPMTTDNTSGRGLQSVVKLMTEDTDLFLALKDDYRESLEQFNDALLQLESDPKDRSSLEDASRQLHNIKGFSNRMRAPKLGQLAHVLEDILAAVSEGRLVFDEGIANLLFQGMDLFVQYLRDREVPADKAAVLVGEIEPLLFSAIEEESVAKDLEELLPDFIAAARDNVEAINRGLSKLEKDSSDREVVQEVYRNAHSLKGSAFTMGFERMGRLAHHMEDVLRAFQRGLLPVTIEACDAIFETNDAISVMLDTLAAGKRMKVDVERRIAKLARFLSEEVEEEIPKVETVHVDKPEKIPTPAEPEVTPPEATPAIDTVRVPTAKLDELVNLASEAVIAQIRLSDELDDLIRVRDRWKRLQSRQGVTPDQAEIGLESESRATRELVQLGDSLDDSSRRLQDAVENTGRHIETLQHRAMEIRMLPLALVFNTLHRAVRDLSRKFEKKVNFQVVGEQTTIDKRILEQISDPLIHLLRNALDHGIETPERRRKSGKAEKGTILLQAEQKGGKVVITLEDDGRGIDPHRLKEVAISRGLVDERHIEEWSEAQLLDLVFIPGFSTSQLVTDVSGRGVGMDVVRANVAKLKGQVQVNSELGHSTSFVISLPLTLATVHALLLACAGETLAVPTFSVATTLQIPREELRSVQGKQAILHHGEILPVRNLSTALGWKPLDSSSQNGGPAMLVVMQAGERKVGFLVEEILGEREIVTKDLGSHLQKVRYVAGATILGSGAVALILDVNQLIWQEWPEVIPELQPQREEEIGPERRQVILVVEDQVVTRQMERSILEAAGYEVVTAENGLDALNKLRQQEFDLVVTDIRVPKMDGFTLTEEIRASERTRTLPVVIVTSMERERDKRRGLEVGADAYLVKSSFDQRNLINTIETLLGQRRSH
jgi:chemotaxis protein histidine kinase CheA